MWLGKRTEPILVLIDAGVLFLAFSVALYLRFWTAVIPIHHPMPDARRYLVFMLAIIPAWIGSFAVFKLYNRRCLMVGTEEYRRVINAGAVGAMTTMVVVFLTKEEFARGWLLLTWAIGTAGAITARYIFRHLRHRFARRESAKSPVLVVGANDEAAYIADSIDRAKHLGFKVIGAIAGRARSEKIEVLGAFSELSSIVRGQGVEAVVVVPSAISPGGIPKLLRSLGELGVDIYVSPSLADITASRVNVQPIGGIPLIHLRTVEFSGLKFVTKRIFDVIASGVALVLISPLMVGIALAIRRDSLGPVFFKQRRTGRNGTEFDLLKFRTMVANAEGRLTEIAHMNEADGPLFKMKKDPRVTRVGSFMRRFSLDELPQLINVLKGEMSLVGPRPPLPREVEKYTRWERQRLKALPGLTGFWQVSGRSDTSFTEMVKMDIYYIENWSLAFDFYIIARTVPVVLRSKGAY